MVLTWRLQSSNQNISRGGPVLVSLAGYLEKPRGDRGNINECNLISSLRCTESVTSEVLLCHLSSLQRRI